jgi:hypothetical protein
MKFVYRCLCIFSLLTLLDIPAFSQGFDYKMHFPQLPDSSGWKVNATYPMGLADNWQCSETGMISEFDFWGGWLNGQVGSISNIMIAIFADNLGSFPTWYDTYSPGDYTGEIIYPDSSQQLGWYDPYSGTYIENDNNTIIHYTIRNPDGFFSQEIGNEYWFAITVQAQGGTWGWVTSNDHWDSGGNWSHGVPFSWHNLNDPVTPSEELDLSFVIAQYDPIGACCMPDGSCNDMTLSHCQNLGGFFHGAETTCLGDIDPPNGIDDICQPILTGACCYPDLSCNEGILYEDCVIAGGQWFSVESQCGREPGQECNDPENLNWNCSDRLPYGTISGSSETEPNDECLSPNDIAINSAICGSIDSPQDIDYYRLTIPSDSCYNISVTVYGNYTMYTYCAGLGLNPSLEIFDNSCQNRLFYNQDNYGAFPNAAGLDAQYEYSDPSNPHAAGSVLQIKITAEQGSFGPYLMVVNAVRCLPESPLGACCFPEGSCDMLTATDCEIAGGTWSGANAECQGDYNSNGIDDACENPEIGACCLPDGNCQNLTYTDCISIGGVFTLAQCLGDNNSNGIDDYCENPSGCQYTPGDANDNGAFNGIDVSYSVGYFKGGPPPPYSCLCNGSTWYVAGDVNGNCAFNGIDVSYMVSYFKGGAAPIPCPECQPGILVIPRIQSKTSR